MTLTTRADVDRVNDIRAGSVLRVVRRTVKPVDDALYEISLEVELVDPDDLGDYGNEKED